MKKRVFHRGHNIENASGLPNDWKTFINGNLVVNKLTLVKKSIDWWCDMKAFMPPEQFSGIYKPAKQGSRKVEEYKGFKLFNDTGEANQWYIVLGGKLLKGSPVAIKKHLDLVLLKTRQQQQ